VRAGESQLVAQEVGEEQPRLHPTARSWRTPLTVTTSVILKVRNVTPWPGAQQDDRIPP